MAITASAIRSGIPELNFKNVNGFILSDEFILSMYDKAAASLAVIDTSKIPHSVLEILTLYLAQHMLILEQKETITLTLPNNKEQWATRVKDLGLDDTIQGQMFKQFIRVYTNIFDTPEEQAAAPQRGYVIIS